MDHRFMRVGSVSFLNENEEFEVETINPCARLTIARAHGQIDDLIDGAASKQMCVVTEMSMSSSNNKLHVSFSSIDDQFPAFKSIYGYDMIVDN
ncbi:unnamed protein product [Rhizophagus irregularis]|nr:unnamed protein product [Rhizophagus irregularis]